MSDFIQSIIDWIKSLFSSESPSEPSHNARELPTKASQMVGWGNSYEWMDRAVEWENWADALEQAGCNVTPIEFFGYGDKNRIGSPAAILSMLPRFIDLMNSHGILVHLIIYNWNVGGQAGWGKSVCQYPESYMRGLMDQIIAICQGKGVMLEPCTEWGSNTRNSACWRKAESLSKYLATKWTGLKAWNQGSRPGGAPAGWINNWHVNTIDSLGPKNQLITTDTGMILNWLGGMENFMKNHDKLTALVKAAKKNGCGFSGYTCGAPGIDLEGIKIIGQAWNSA